jgi:diaminohydroxyphosphoribosylaminopyrimidine deaminase / 5-amino-6-(5-phosphoribosylamino)uracil reductase
LLTGIGTILADNPLLTDRSGLSRRRSLLRVVLDSKLRLRLKSRIVATANDDLLVFTAATLNTSKARQLQRAGIEIARVRARGGRTDLGAVLAELGKRDILSVLLEAGPSLNGAALAAGLVDKLVLFYAPKLAGDVGVPLARAAKLESDPLRDLRTLPFGPDICIQAYPAHTSRK